METLIATRDRMKEIYSGYAVFFDGFFRFVLALLVYVTINNGVGHMEALKSPVLVTLLAMLNAVLPTNAIIVFAAILTILHLYAYSLMCAGVVVVLFTLMFLLYFRFSPKDPLAVIFTPLAFAMHIPYAVPICAGLGGSPYSCVSVACGALAYYTVVFLNSGAVDVDTGDVESIASALRGTINGIIGNKSMHLFVFAFMVTTLCVYIIKRLKINYSWVIAILSGAVIDLVFIIAGSAFIHTEVSILSLFVGTLFALPIAFILMFFVFMVDYSRTEYLQFEDDEYYYYVKAVPKISSGGFEQEERNIRR